MDPELTTREEMIAFEALRMAVTLADRGETIEATLARAHAFQNFLSPDERMELDQ